MGTLVTEDNISIEALNQFSSGLDTLQTNGIRCISGSFEIVFVIVKIAITIYIEVSTLILAMVNTAILEISGQCPTGFELGDWNTGEGECCCDPDAQPEEPDFVLEEPVLIPPMYEEPVLIDGEEPILINGEEPIMEEPIPIYDMEEPIPINGNGSGFWEEPILISMFEEPILIGGEEPILIGGEEPIPIFMFEEPILIVDDMFTSEPQPTLPVLPPYEPAPPKPEKKFCKCRKDDSFTPGPYPSPSVPSPTPSVPSPTPTAPSPTPIGPSPSPTIPSPSPTIPSPSPDILSGEGVKFDQESIRLEMPKL